MIIAQNNQSTLKAANKPVQRRRCGTGTKTLTRKQIEAEIKIGKQQRC